MAIAASLWFDDGLEAAIRALWGEAARQGISDSQHRGPDCPHITLGVWQPFDDRRFHGALQERLGDVPALDLVFGAVGGFPTDPGVVYLQPGVTEALGRLRRDVHEVADALGARWASPYPPGTWFPHCTIAWQLDPDRFRR